MTDTDALKEWIENKGLKVSWIADKLNISRTSLYKKMNNKVEFKASEIVAFGELGMTNRERDKIFLNQCRI